MARILAIDYGKKRTGIAVTDTLQLIANGLCTVETHILESWLKEYFTKEIVERIVIGLPRQLSGELSENATRIIAFEKRLAKLFPTIPVIEVDERFTSSLAHQTMLDGGLGKKARQNKALVDEISATIILQSYMESQRL
ncbi:MAG: Holliday junction resolvase RuvX [Bacteroidaceae bacterium]|nr:Holliday junction resolvase RuvX [Bacteroidaceae bacterium]MBP9637341.1 Holliday junction resolvase RuvX [Bacteroidaceae bacterium]